MIGSLLVGQAAAATVSSTYCFRYENLTALLDNHSVGVGSLFTTNNEKARGIKFTLVPRGGGDILSGHTSNVGGDAGGCLQVNVDDTKVYDVYVVLESQRANGTIVRMVERDLSDNWVVPRYLMSNVLTGHSPTGGQTYGPDWPGNLDQPIHAVHAAANHATWRWDLGITGGVVEIDIDDDVDYTPCQDGPNVSCYLPNTNRIHIANRVGYRHVREQAKVAHETGHCMWNHRNGDSWFAFDEGVQPNDCGPQAGHFLNTKEWQSLAITEALAWFYAAVAFNDDGQTACELDGSTTSLDWNRNGSDDNAPIINCAGVVSSQNGTALTNATNYYGQFCTAGLDVNRAVELDWLRFLWKLRTSHGYTREELQEMVDAANPHSWVEADVSSQDVVAPFGVPDDFQNRPFQRMKAGMVDAKEADFETRAATHGVNQ
jgi:hypothetical protein